MVPIRPAFCSFEVLTRTVGFLKMHVAYLCSVSWPSQFVVAACNGSNVSARTLEFWELELMVKRTDRTDITQLV